MTAAQKLADVVVDIAFALKTTNPNNGSQGFSRNASFAKARRRKAQRAMAHAQVLAARPLPDLPVVVTVTRIAPRRLDDDNLAASAKSLRDGIADALGCKDNDPRVSWRYEQAKGQPKQYAVRITIAQRRPAA